MYSVYTAVHSGSAETRLPYVAKNKYDMSSTSLPFPLINLHDLFGVAFVSVYSMLVILRRLDCTQLEKVRSFHPIGYPAIFIHPWLCMDKGLPWWGGACFLACFLPGFNSFSAERLLWSTNCSVQCRYGGPRLTEIIFPRTVCSLHCKSGSFEKYLSQLYSTDQIAMVWFCENHH